MGRLKFKEIAKERFKTQRNIVVSESYDTMGNLVGYSVSEQFIGEECGKPVEFFLSSGLGIVNRRGLAKLKLAVDKACEKAGISTDELEDVTYEETKEEDF